MIHTVDVELQTLILPFLAASPFLWVALAVSGGD